MANDTPPKILGREEILAAVDRPLVLVDVPEWGGAVYVRAISAVERDAFELGYAEDKTNLRAKLAALCCCDEEGAALFDHADDIAALGDKSGAALDRVFEAATKLNKFTGKDIDELEKN